MKKTLQPPPPPPPPPPPTQTQCQQYLSCYQPDFDETLKVRSREHLEQIPTVTETHVRATFVLATFVHIMNILVVTAPILTKFYRYVPGTIFNRFQPSREHLSRRNMSW